MEVVVTTAAIRCAKLQSNHHHQQTNTQRFTGRMPFLSPNQQCRGIEESSGFWEKFLSIYHNYTASQKTIHYTVRLLSLLLKEFRKLVNIWQSYWQE